MSSFALVLDGSRKAKNSRNVYEYLRAKTAKEKLIPEVELGDHKGIDGIKVEPGDKYRILNIRLHDEHLSPYFKTDLNLFQLLMMDEKSDITIFRAEKGYLFVFEDLPPGPQPFGQNGFDMR